MERVRGRPVHKGHLDLKQGRNQEHSRDTELQEKGTDRAKVQRPDSNRRCRIRGRHGGSVPA